MYSETNKLIAEFMGAKIKSKRFDYMPTSSKNLSYDACYWFEDFNITYDGINVNNLKFDLSEIVPLIQPAHKSTNSFLYIIYFSFKLF